MPHTSGQWVITEERTEDAILLWVMPENDKTRVCRVVVYDGEEMEQRANAKLITAAPDLLAALKTLISLSSHLNEFDLAQANEAITKATL